MGSKEVVSPGTSEAGRRSREEIFKSYDEALQREKEISDSSVGRHLLLRAMFGELDALEEEDLMSERRVRALPLSLRNFLTAISESRIGGPFPRLGRMGGGNTVEVGKQRVEVPLGETPLPEAGRRVIVYTQAEGVKSR